MQHVTRTHKLSCTAMHNNITQQQCCLTQSPGLALIKLSSATRRHFGRSQHPEGDGTTLSETHSIIRTSVAGTWHCAWDISEITSVVV